MFSHSIKFRDIGPCPQEKICGRLFLAKANPCPRRDKERRASARDETYHKALLLCILKQTDYLFRSFYPVFVRKRVSCFTCVHPLIFRRFSSMAVFCDEHPFGYYS